VHGGHAKAMAFWPEAKARTSLDTKGIRLNLKLDGNQAETIVVGQEFRVSSRLSYNRSLQTEYIRSNIVHTCNRSLQPEEIGYRV
jgi:hypothetical protein